MLGGTHTTALNMERGSESDQKMTLRTVVLLSYWDNVVRNQTGVRAGERSVPLPSHSCDRGPKLSLAGFEKFHAEFQGFDDWPYWISAIDRYTYRSTSLVHGFKMHTCSCDCWCILEWSAPNTIYTHSVTHFHTSHMLTFTHKHTQHIHRYTDTHTHTYLEGTEDAGFADTAVTLKPSEAPPEHIQVPQDLQEQRVYKQWLPQDWSTALAAA